ncbi:MAG: hypothetical protein KUG79_16810 [Pseudomonadales bacterium]|nr:hypothetical protein [Pseudomonadales bacterium]
MAYLQESREARYSTCNESIVFPGRELAPQVDSTEELDLASLLPDFIAEFDPEKEIWVNNATVRMYKAQQVKMDLAERETLYEQLRVGVQEGKYAVSSLYFFLLVEQHPQVVWRAVNDYLTYRSCDLVDEFAAVNEVVQVLADPDTVNKGAILAGLVGIGDRRINAVARAARHMLSAEDIFSFSRIHVTTIRTSSVEFCLDWLVELNHKFHQETVDNIAEGLLLMVEHDLTGVVEDLSEINYIGFRKTKVLQSKNFESYFHEIMPILRYLKQCDNFEPALTRIIDAWEGHQNQAQQLRLLQK